MMNVKDIIAKIKQKFPDREPTLIVPYNNTSVLVCAPVKKLGEDDFSDPYFLVSTNGTIKHFIPTSDINSFSKAIRSGKILYKKSK